MKRVLAALAIGAGLAWACAFDDSLREYLHARFWLPFAKPARSHGAKGTKWMSEPFAGLSSVKAPPSLGALRLRYSALASPDGFALEGMGAAIAAARADRTLSAKEREEVDLIDAKADMRAGSALNPAPLRTSKTKLLWFLESAKTPEYRSEARGWLARVHYLLGEQSAAGKLYLDELSSPRSNLSAEVVANSLAIVYGWEGSGLLVEQLEDYFDTPDHAAFAIHLLTNPPDRDYSYRSIDVPPDPPQAIPYQRINTLLQRHARLFRSQRGAELLALLGMRVALRAADPKAALKIAAEVPAQAAVRNDPDFLWMVASAHAVSRNWAAAEAPLLRLFGSRRATADHRAAAAYGLTGVYQKAGNRVEQIRFALWLSNATGPQLMGLSVYWPASGFDIGLVLDAEAPVDALRAFLEKYPNAKGAGAVKYALAVRLARGREYGESARLYDEVGAARRAKRMRDLERLHGASTTQGRYELAVYLAANPDRIYFNDRLWSGFQRYALIAGDDARLDSAERKRLLGLERTLKDEQEERWQAYLILRDVVGESGHSALGERAARLAVNCLRRIHERFGREKEIRTADLELSRWLSSPRNNGALD